MIEKDDIKLEMINIIVNNVSLLTYTEYEISI
mgnify:CR=1 FL=1